MFEICIWQAFCIQNRQPSELDTCILTVRVGWKSNKFAFKSTNNKGIQSGHFASEEPDEDIEPKAMTRWLTLELRLGYVCLC